MEPCPGNRAYEENLHFERWHFKGPAEANAFAEAFRSKAVVLVRYIEKMRFVLVPLAVEGAFLYCPDLKTGPIELSDSDSESADPLEHVETKVFPGFGVENYLVSREPPSRFLLVGRRNAGPCH